MTKKIIIGITVIFSLLIYISCYAYVSNQKLSEYVKESTTLREKILLLGDLRTEIVKCSQSEKLYLLTNKNDYKKQFNNNLKQVYIKIDDMYNQKYISKTEKDKLLFAIDKYKNSSSTYFNENYSNSITPELENNIIQYNSEQLDVLKEVTLDITSESDDFSQKDNLINAFYSNQTKLIQGASSFITIIISGFLYYFKKKLKKDNVDIEDIINYLTSCEETTNNKVSIPSSTTDNSKNLVTCKQIIGESEVLLSNAKLLYIQSLKLRDQYEKSDIILSQIDISIKSLKLKLYTLDDYSIAAQNVILDDIENQLINLKILFKSLPYYNEFIIDISKNMISKDEN